MVSLIDAIYNNALTNISINNLLNMLAGKKATKLHTMLLLHVINIFCPR